MQRVGLPRPLSVRALRIPTAKLQAVLRAVLLARVAAQWTGLAGIVRIHLDGKRPCKRGLVGDHAVQFGKGPLGSVPVGSTRFGRE